MKLDHQLATTLALESCRSAWARMTEICEHGPVRNFVQVLDMSDFLVETELFPRAALEAYSALNMEEDLREEQKQYVSELRGGAQGDYREGMKRKIANVVDCLSKFPQSKRAVITVCNEPVPHHSRDEDAKCLRELHLYLDDGGRLSGTVFFRAQAACLFPKNIHLIGSVMSAIAAQLPHKPALGSLFYLATVLVSDRS
jgi:thymidylate synthase